jgi:photosystem II stability/assembly factor-like uncharacterized protein
VRSAIPLSLLAVALLGGAARASADPRHFDDATLRAVQFVDEQEGWAAGDEGVIWHTLDGGKSWARQPTGIRASLRSICFLNAEVGWAVGRDELPTGGSAGVILFTRDGGLKWQRLLANALPGLNQVCFTDPAIGFLLGDGTDQFPSGVFRTADGGRTWEPVAGPRTTSWYAGVFTEPQGGLLAGSWARLAKWRPDKFSIADDVERTEGRDIRGLASGPQQAIAVAQGGLVLTSVSGGAKWGFADLKLPTGVVTCLDFHALHVAGKRTWVVGRPGSVVLHSDDAGQSWRLQKTGCPMPLHGVWFANDKRGWAVGEAGAILATADGGQSWTVQRQGGRRAAVLIVQARSQDLPLDTVARLGGADGLLTCALRVVAPDPASAALCRAADPMRYAAAARRAGAMTAETLWAFSLPQHLAAANREGVLDYWNRRHAQHAADELLRQLVLALRLWRPNVVLGDHPQGKVAASALVAEALQEAVRQAGDPNAFPEQIDLLGLEPWQVSKVYALSDMGSAAVAHDNDEFLDGLESTPRDHATWAADLLPDGPAVLPRQRAFRLLQTQAKGAEGQTDLMHGLAAKPGDVQRKIGPPNLDPEVVKAAREKKQLQALAERLTDPAAVQSQLLPVLAKLPDEQGAAAAAAIAAHYLRHGRWDLAHETYAVMVERYPAHPLSAGAYRWLVQHDSSSEVRRRYELNQFALPPKAAAGDSGSDKAPGGGGLQQAAALEKSTATPADPLAARSWYQSTLDYGKRLAGFGPLYASDPVTQFCLQSARRGLGDLKNPPEWFGKFKDYVPHGPWHEAANAELWLAGRTPQMPRKLARCRLTDVRPHLDGKFDDPCWQDLKPLMLDNAVGDVAREYPTAAMLAYDQEFLYVALKCRHPRGKHIPPVKVRTRDADVEPYDRVSILLDLDRDYATYFHLQVDQRGCVREDCWGDVAWNPRWFVAIRSDEDSWQIEAAIPLGELTSQPVAVKSAWAFNVVRVIPGQGVQSWSQPADVQPRPEGMSLLLFQQDADRAPAGPMPPAK